jgi:hypothetical protein
MPDAPAVIEWVKSCEPRPLVVVDSLAGFFQREKHSRRTCSP